MTDDIFSDPQPSPLPTTQMMHKTTRPGDTMSVVLEQAFNRDSLYQLRAAVAAHAAQAGVAPEQTQDVVCAVHELAANVIRHGSGHGRVRVWVNEDRLHCQVTDAGPSPCPTGMTADLGAGPASAPPPPWPVEPDHGLWLVCRLADQTTFDAGPPSTAAFSLHLRAAEMGQHATEPDANRDAIVNHQRGSGSS